MADELRVDIPVVVDKSSVAKAEKELQDFQEKDRKVDVKLVTPTKDIDKLKKSTEQAKESVKGFRHEVATAVTRTIEWSLAMGALYGSLNKVREGISFISNLDDALNEIRIVTQKTSEEVAVLGQRYNQLAKEMKVTTVELANSATALFRQGLNAREVEDRLVAITKASKASGVAVSEVTEFVTSGVNALKVSAEEFNDVLLAVSSEAGTNYQELGTALQKTANSANNAGIEIQKISSFLATVSETTRESAESIGTSFKTIIARFSKVNEETGQLNEDLNNVAKAFTSVGIAFTDSEGQIRPVSDLLDELSTQWGDLDTNTKNYLKTQIAGTRQGDRFLALMDNYGRSLELYDVALQSAGTQNEQFETSLDRLSNSATDIKNAWDSLFLDSIDKGYVQAVANLIVGIINLANELGALTTVTLLVIGYFRIFKKEAFATAIEGISKAIAGLVTKMTALEVSAGAVNTALGAIGIALALGAVAYNQYQESVRQTTLLVQKQAEAQKELYDIINKGEAQQQEKRLENLENLRRQYVELSNVLPKLKQRMLELEDAGRGQSEEAINISNGYNKAKRELDALEMTMAESGVNFQNITEYINKLQNALDNNNSTTEEAIKQAELQAQQLELLDKAFAEASSSAGIQAETFAQLQEMYPDLADQIRLYGDDVIAIEKLITKNKIEEVKKQVEATNVAIKAERQRLEIMAISGEVTEQDLARLNGLRGELDGYVNELNNLKVRQDELSEISSKRKSTSEKQVELMTEEEKLLRDINHQLSIQQSENELNNQSLESQIEGNEKLIDLYNDKRDILSDLILSTRQERNGVSENSKEYEELTATLQKYQQELLGVDVSIKKIIESNRDLAQQKLQELVPTFEEDLERYDKEIEKIDQEIALMKERNKQLDEEAKRVKLVSDLKEKERRRAELAQQKTVQLFTGTGFEFVADPNALSQADKDVTGARSALSEFDAQRERDNQTKQLEERKKGLQKQKDETKRFLDTLNRMIKSNGFIQQSLVSNIQDQLKNIEGGKYAERLSQLQQFVDEYNMLQGQTMSSPRPEGMLSGTSTYAPKTTPSNLGAVNNTTSNTVTNNTPVNITVNGATNPEQTGKVVRNHIIQNLPY